MKPATHAAEFIDATARQPDSPPPSLWLRRSLVFVLGGGLTLALPACGGDEAVGDAGEVDADSDEVVVIPEQPAEVAHEDMGYRRGVLTWEGHPYTGVARGTHGDGSLRTEIPLNQGLRHGTVREYYPGGGLSMRAEFVDGQRHGERRYFDEEGNLIKLQQWQDDAVVESLEGDDIPPEAIEQGTGEGT